MHNFNGKKASLFTCQTQLHNFPFFCRRRRRCRVHFPQLAESTTGEEEEEHPEQNPTQRETLCTIRIPIQRCLQPHQHHHRRQPLGEGFARTHRSAFKDGKASPEMAKHEEEDDSCEWNKKSCARHFHPVLRWKVLQPRKWQQQMAVFRLLLCKYAILQNNQAP